jgi:hypothetical protein
MNGYFRLQELKSVSATGTQSVIDAQECGQYRTLVTNVRVVTAAASGTLELQHAPVLDDDAFVTLSGTTFSLGAAGATSYAFSNLLRYVRWNVTAISGTAQIIVDCVGKER